MYLYQQQTLLTSLDVNDRKPELLELQSGLAKEPSLTQALLQTGSLKMYSVWYKIALKALINGLHVSVYFNL